MAMLCGGLLSCEELEFHGLELHVIFRPERSVYSSVFAILDTPQGNLVSVPQTAPENDAFDSN